MISYSPVRLRVVSNFGQREKSGCDTRIQARLREHGDTPDNDVQRLIVVESKVNPFNSCNLLQFPQLRFFVQFEFRYSQLVSLRTRLCGDFCRLMKTVMYAVDAEKRWRPISAQFVSTSRAQTRTRITVINAESAGEFPKTKVVFCLASTVSWVG